MDTRLLTFFVNSRSLIETQDIVFRSVHHLSRSQDYQQQEVGWLVGCFEFYEVGGEMRRWKQEEEKTSMKNINWTVFRRQNILDFQKKLKTKVVMMGVGVDR